MKMFRRSEEQQLTPRKNVRKSQRDLAVSKLNTAINRVRLVGLDALTERAQLSSAMRQLKDALMGCIPCEVGEFPDDEWLTVGPKMEEANGLHHEIMAKLKEMYPEAEAVIVKKIGKERYDAAMKKYEGKE